MAIKLDWHIEPAKPEHVPFLARMMRQADRDEVWAIAHYTPEEALRISLAESCEAYSVIYQAYCIAMFGVTRYSLLSDIGVVWMFGSDALSKKPVLALRNTLKYVKAMKKSGGFRVLVNMVDARHTLTLNWLKWAGFEIMPAVPYGVEGRPFHEVQYRG